MAEFDFSEFEEFLIREITAAAESIEPAEKLDSIRRAIEAQKVHEYGSVRGPVNPDYIRDEAGIFLRSFRLREFQALLKWCGETQSAMARNKIRGDLVFTKRSWMWYVYLIPDGSVITGS